MLPYFTQPSLSIGPLTFRAFGAIVALSAVIGLAVVKWRFRQAGLDRTLGERLTWWAVIGGFLGAHLFSVLFYYPHKLVENPLVLFKLWEDIASFGGMLGGVTGMWLFFLLRARDVDWPTRLAFLDVAGFAFPIALTIGRLACAVAHDHPGVVTDFPLAISLESAPAREFITRVYADAGRLAELPPAPALAQLGFHDLGLTEAVYLAAVVVPVVLLLGRRQRPPGLLAGAFVLLYMPVRFLLDFLRVADVRYGGLTPAQWLALAALLALLVIPLWARRRRAPRDLTPQQVPPG